MNHDKYSAEVAPDSTWLKLLRGHMAKESKLFVDDSFSVFNEYSMTRPTWQMLCDN